MHTETELHVVLGGRGGVGQAIARQLIAQGMRVRAGVAARPTTLSAALVRVLGIFNPMLRDLGELLYEFDAPYLVDGSRYQRAFGGTPTPHSEVIHQTIAWYRGHVPALAHAT